MGELSLSRIFSHDMVVKRSGHGVYTLSYHVVGMTKYRRKILNPDMVECLQSLILKLARSMSGVLVKQMGFHRGHIHFVMVVPPKYTVADIMGELKSRSALLLREKFDFLKKFIGEKTSFGRRDTLLVA